MDGSPLHKEAINATKGLTAHAGLWYDRFFNGYTINWEVEPGVKTDWVKTAATKVGADTMLKEYATRQSALMTSLQGEALQMVSEWNFVTGMGNNHPVENGFAWHSTLGVPYLTGAAVKGMLRAWCEVWTGFSDDKISQWFGSSEKAGELIFFDALPTQPVTLTADIMTPHYGDWYAKGDQPQKDDGSNAPADWHDPVPIPFLAVAPNQSFQFAIARRPVSIIPIIDVVNELIDALENLGAGAKTAAGYGRFFKPTIEDQFNIWKNDREIFLSCVEDGMNQVEKGKDKNVRARQLSEIEDIMRIHFRRILNNPEKEKRKGEYQYQDPQRSLAIRLNKLLAESKE